MRSAPAMKPSSAAATAVPRSLCGCSDSTIESRRARWRDIHSMASAYTFGVAISTVAGRLMMTLRSGVGAHTSVTASQTSTANSSSVPVNDSGEYSKKTSVSSATCSAYFWHSCAPWTAMSLMPSLSRPNTTRRCSVEVELYRWTIACFAPRIASNVFSIRCSRDCVSTWMTTSSGIASSSISCRTKSKSVWEADGKPTSISLKPMRTRSSNIRRLRDGVIGSIRAWLPSRRSTAHQRGACSMARSGQVRSASATGAKGRYRWNGMAEGCCALRTSYEVLTGFSIEGIVGGRPARTKPRGEEAGLVRGPRRGCQGAVARTTWCEEGSR